jgi:hypothetical protein
VKVLRSWKKKGPGRGGYKGANEAEELPVYEKTAGEAFRRGILLRRKRRRGRMRRWELVEMQTETG